MSTNFCSECGTELNQDAQFCRSCGTKVPLRSNETAAEGESDELKMESQTVGEGEDAKESGSSNTMFQITSGLFAGYFLFVILGAIISNNALIGLGVLSLLISLVTMYVDLRNLEKRLWGTRPILWIIGAFLLYIIVAPLYIYKRKQV
jgi:ribosomal protein L40E